MSRIKLSLGYDTERPYGEWAETEKGKEFRLKQIDFVRKMNGVLNLAGVPRTHYILGNYLERCTDTMSIKDLREVYDVNNSLMELQQHSYSHPIFRPTKEGDKSVISAQEFIFDVDRAKKVIFDITGAVTNGLRTPRGYDRDLSDIPEILNGLTELGFNFVSSDLRSSDSIDGPFTKERQPHSYKNAGYPKIIEMPSHGWQDAIFIPAYKEKFLLPGQTLDNPLVHYEGLFNQARKMSEETGKNSYISLCMHPWCMMEWDKDLEIHKSLIEKARNNKIEIVSYGTAAKEIFQSENI